MQLLASKHPKEVKTREWVSNQALTGAGTGNLRFENEKLVVTPMFRRNGHISTPSVILSSHAASQLILLIPNAISQNTQQHSLPLT